MPFKSSKQRRFMYAKHPAIAARWSAEEKVGKAMDLVELANAAFGPVAKASKEGKGRFAESVTGAAVMGGGLGHVSGRLVHRRTLRGTGKGAVAAGIGGALLSDSIRRSHRAEQAVGQ